MKYILNVLILALTVTGLFCVTQVNAAPYDPTVPRGGSSSLAIAGAVSVQKQTQKQASSVSINSTYQSANQVGTIGLPSLTTGLCLGSMSIGGGNRWFTLGGGTTTKDEECEIRYNSIRLEQLGQYEASTLILCQVPSMKQALELTGFDCRDGSDKSPAILPKTQYRSVSGYTPF